MASAPPDRHRVAAAATAPAVPPTCYLVDAFGDLLPFAALTAEPLRVEDLAILDIGVVAERSFMSGPVRSASVPPRTKSNVTIASSVTRGEQFSIFATRD